MRATQLLDGRSVRVYDVRCDALRGGCGAPEHVRATQLVIARRGVFAVHRGRDVVLADAASAVLLRAGDEQRVSHPIDGGDRCTTIDPSPELAEEVFGPGGRAARLTSRTVLGAAVLAGRLAREDADALGAEELALLLAVEIARGPAPVRVTPAGQRRADEVRALLAARPAERWRLADVAREVAVSPYHLARGFRAATGQSIGEYLLRVRVHSALDRLQGGENDLARLALDLGFTTHSHFSARFRAVFGLTPSQARERTIVTAVAAARG